MSDLLSQLDPSWDQELRQVKALVEALLFVSTEPVTLEQISEASEMPLDTTRLALQELMRDYETRSSGLRIHLLDGGYQILTRPEHAEPIRRLRQIEKPAPGLSRAALEVLAIIAYKQPVTRAEIESLRGVSSDSALRTLLDRNLVEEVGRKAVIGRPVLFGTTSEFLRKFGLNALSDLPPLKPAETLA